MTFLPGDAQSPFYDAFDSEFEHFVKPLFPWSEKTEARSGMLMYLAEFPSRI